MSIRRFLAAPAAALAVAALAVPRARAVVSEDVVWTRGSRIHLHATLVIDSPGSLTIEPGVEVLFHERASLIIRGRLAASGSGAPIRFAALEAGRPWGGVRIEAGDAVLAGFVISDARVGIECAGGMTTIADGEILRSVEAGARILDPARLTIVRCRFRDGLGDGVHAAGGAVTITESEMAHCGAAGLRVAAGARLTLRGSAIHDNAVGLETDEAAIDLASADGSAWGCNGADVRHHGTTPLLAAHQYWGGGAPAVIEGLVDTAPHLTELPAHLRSLERLVVHADAADGGDGHDGVAFTWHSLADCAQHLVLSSGSPDEGFSENAAAPEPLADGRIVEYFRLETRPWSS